MRVQLVAVCSFFLAVAAFAQSDRGTITGTVADPAGAMVATAPVEIRNVETGAVYQAGTSATGNYTLAQLPAGQYELSVSVAGFKRFVRKSITVNVAETTVSISCWKWARTRSRSQSPKPLRCSRPKAASS